jgi:putative oxidoreductase
MRERFLLSMVRDSRAHREAHVPSPRVRKAAGLAAKWIPALLLVLIFAPQGWSKFSDTSGWAVAFRHWGYPDWFRMLIGAMELSAVALLLSGRGAVLGALLIVVVMLGGMGTHIVFDQGRHLTSEVVPLTLALVVLLMRREEVKRWLPRRKKEPPAEVRLPAR